MGVKYEFRLGSWLQMKLDWLSQQTQRSTESLVLDNYVFVDSISVYDDGFVELVSNELSAACTWHGERFSLFDALDWYDLMEVLGRAVLMAGCRLIDAPDQAGQRVLDYIGRWLSRSGKFGQGDLLTLLRESETLRDDARSVFLAIGDLMMTEEKRARLTLIESCRLADYLRTDPSCIAYRKTCASYSDLATWVTGHWSGPRVPVGTLQTICEEYGLQLAKASVVADLVAREGIVTLCNVVNQILDLMRADGDDVEDLAVAVSSLQSYDGEADIS